MRIYLVNLSFFDWCGWARTPRMPEEFLQKMAAEKKNVFFLRVFTTKKVNIFLKQFLSDFQESQICLDRQVASSHGGVLGPLVDRWKIESSFFTIF